MKLTHLPLHCFLLLVIVLVLGSAMLGAAPVFAAPSGSATSSATPSNAAPSIGQQIVVSINIDMSGVDPPDDKLGSFTGHLDWNPAVLAYNSNSAILAGFVGVVNTSSAGSGHMIFNGAKVSGATGNTVVLTITFDVVGAGTSVLHLEYPSMAAATTFVELLPILTVTDGLVVVNSAAQRVYLPWVSKH